VRECESSFGRGARGWIGVGVAVALLLPVALPAQGRPARADSAGLVTLLGRDTLGLERWVRTDSTIEAEAVVRTPQTSYRRYRMSLAPDGNVRRFEERLLDPAAPARATRVDLLEREGAGWVRRVTEGDSTRTSRFAADASALPFLDLVHWQYELILDRVQRQGITAQPLLMGSRAVSFPLERRGADRVVITHPSRGPSVARMDPRGRLLSFDGAQATRKVVVSRVPWLEIEPRARAWAATDRAGGGIGELSGRGREEERVGGATIRVDYGTPTRRGREIFGVVVPWGEIWRTGANRATHLSTDRTLVLGDPATGTLTVPAGEYTLFSRLAPEGGELIVSRQTGQSGTAYDPARDLGRVRLMRRAGSEQVERFTIDVAPLDVQRGELRLVWDRSVFAVPLRVQP